MPMLELGSAIKQKQITDITDPFFYSYFQQHITALSGQQPWTTRIDSIRVTTDTDPDVGRYQEVLVYFEMTPPSSSLLRSFTFNYTAIIHEVVTHKILVFVKQDWKNGVHHDNSGDQIGMIRMDVRSGIVYPLSIDLEKGTYWSGFQHMVMLGIEHIREGADHLLFLFVLMLPVVVWSRLIKVVTAFTIGHSLSLICGTFGWIVLPSQLVEVCIAITILISAIHVIRPLFSGKEMYVAAGFGFIHGLAFAAALANLDLAPTEMALSIVGFNIGIEIMQLFVILCTVPCLFLLKSKYLVYAGGVVAIIASVGWVAERLTNASNPVSMAMEQVCRQGRWLMLALAGAALIAYGTRWVKARSLS